MSPSTIRTTTPENRGVSTPLVVFDPVEEVEPGALPLQGSECEEHAERRATMKTVRSWWKNFVVISQALVATRRFRFRKVVLRIDTHPLTQCGTDK